MPKLLIVKENLITIKIHLEFIRCFPHLILYFYHKNNETIKADVARWMSIYEINRGKTMAFLYLLSFFPEFRNIFYHRVGFWKYFLNPLCPKLSTLYILTDKIGKGLFIQHGFATIIAATSIGENCWINQQVTIGYSAEKTAPYIRDNVTINAGAKVIGGIRVGNNSIVGANAVVARNVPDDCTVIGAPAKIIRRNGIKVSELKPVEQVDF